MSLTKELEEQLKAQRDKLLDLSGNNRLIDFKFKIKENARSQNYLRIVDEVPELIIDKLNVDKRFEVIANTKEKDKDEPYELDLKLKSQIKETLPQYKDFDIQTNEKEPIFSRTCDKLFKKNKLELDERGLNSLCISVGFLRWFEEEKSNNFREYYSPLILYPVQMVKERSLNGFQYNVEASEQDTNLNVCLIQKMSIEYGLKLPELELDDEGQPLVEKFFDSLNQILKRRNNDVDGPDWELKYYSTISNFSFRNISIWWDTNFFNQSEENGWQVNPLEEKELLKDFISGIPSSDVEPLGNMDISQDRDEKNQTSNTVPKLISDADSTQYKVIVKALEGKNLIVQGPPGTGKSQTITNIIGALLEKEKKILFAADKRAALEVVRNRLAEKSLAHFTLDAHGKSKGNVIESIKSRMNTRIGRFDRSKYVDNFKQLKEVRNQLNEYVNCLNEPLEVNDESITLHELIWQDVKNKIIFNDPVEKEFLKEAKSVDIEIIDRARRELLKPKLDQYAKTCRQIIDANFFEITNKKYIPETQSELDSLTKASNKALLQYKNIEKDLETVEIGWNDISQIKDNNLNAELVIYKDILETPISSDVALNDTTLEGISKIDVLVKKREEKELFLDSWITPFVKSNAKFEALESLLNDLEENFQETEKFNNIGEFIQALIKVQNSIQVVIRNLGRNSKEYAKSITYGKFRSSIKLVKFFKNDSITESSFKKLLESTFNNNETIFIEESLRILQRNYQISEKLKSKNINLENVLDIGSERFAKAILDIDSAGFLGCLFDKEFRKAKVLWKSISSDKRPKNLELSKIYSLCKKYCLRLGEEKDLNTSIIGLDNLKEIAVEIKDIKRFFESLEDIEKNYFEIDNVLESFLIFKEINFENNELDFPELEEIQIIKELTLSESLEKSSSISSLLNNKIISLGEEPKDKIYTLNCQNLEQIIDDLKDFKDSVNDLQEELEKSFLFNGENLEFTLSKDAINNILKLFGNLKTEEFPENLSRHLAEESINKAFLLLNKYLNIKNDQKMFYENLEDENLSGFIKANYDDRKLDKISNLNIEVILNILDLLRITGNNLGLLLDYFRDKYSIHDLGINKGIEEIISISLESGIASSLLFDSALLNKISEKASLEIKLSRYKGETLNQLKKQFCELDKEFIKNTSIYLNNNLYKPNDECLIEEPSQGRSPKLFTEGKLIRHEEKKSKRHLPLRLLFKQAYKSIINLHPCVMMSPSTAAQYLPKKTDIFDVLIIDEASQMKPEQAFSLIARCKQMIIVGDQKQLPPSSRFEKDYSTDEILEDDVDVEYSESILELADKVIGSKNALSLGWHYRSRHTSLIDFSNYYFYDNKLTVFASNNVGSKVVHKPVDNSQYRGGINLPEVKAVMDALLEQVKSDKEKSIIIATMNQQQESEVTLALEAELQNNKMLRDFDSKHQGNLDELVVKKLEDIQGDERDVVIISTVYGPDADGKITQMFGDINKANGHRRLNVLFTRAKHKVILVTSLKSSNIKESKREGPQILKKYLEYAEKGEITDLSRRTSGTTENAFEESIRQALTNRGYLVDAQVGSGGYSIDLAIRDPNDKSRYILAVECDGKAYHSSYSARANDRLRQEVLEGKGWNFFRIWSADWNRDPIAELDQLDELVKKLSS